MASYSLWCVRKVEREVAALSKTGAASLEALLSEARGHCERALRLIRKGKAEEAAVEIKRALEKLSKAQEASGRESGGVDELIERVEEVLSALKGSLKGGKGR